MYVCVCFIDLGGVVDGRGSEEIYLSEQRRIGDREERRGMCREEKERLKGEAQKEISYRKTMKHIENKVRGLLRQNTKCKM